MSSKDPASLKVKEVMIDDTRYIVCQNPAQARKEASDRENIVAALKAQLKKGAKSLVGNKGPDVQAKDPSGQTRSLYDLKAPYVIVYMFNPDPDAKK